ncbi:MAG TPA: type I DNA topoisomerase [Candidatus Acidoferrales bacterium]|nr:type I DNA topoisomerase [Candidatus Acidoferrales bacterium]
MGRSLVIVESPAKAKTINKYLGKNYTVKASIGHVMDLPKKTIGIRLPDEPKKKKKSKSKGKGKAAESSAAKKPITLDDAKIFEPTLLIIPGKGKVINDLRKSASSADAVYLAGDPDREGEAISQHLALVLSKPAKFTEDEVSSNGNGNGAGKAAAEAAKEKEKEAEKKGKASAKGKAKLKKDKDEISIPPIDPKKIFRVTFNEITPKAIRAAFEHPRQVDANLVDAQQARRVLDRIVGYKISPLLWDKVRRGLSAGRVQTVALRLIVEREQEIRAFVPKEYWTIHAMLEAGEPPIFEAKLYRHKGEEIEVSNQEAAQKIVDAVSKAKWQVSSITQREKKRNPPPPFTTSKLQQASYNRLRFTAKRTMALAQRLYEGVELGEEGSVALITYMRTDSVHVSSDALAQVRELIPDKFGASYLPEKPNFYKSKKDAQEAHEAVRPTDVTKTPEDVRKYLDDDVFKLYQLIWQRFVASQMMPAIFDQTTIDIAAGDYTFRATGSVQKFDGFLRVYQTPAALADRDDDEKDDDGESRALPRVSEGQALRLDQIRPDQHFTEPPPRYTEATLVKDLEEKGIGRPSTYASIISTIVDREYVKKEQGRFTPTMLGERVSDLLVKAFDDVFDVTFTARLEEELDEIEEGKLPWRDSVKEFWEKFVVDLAHAGEHMVSYKIGLPTGKKCEKCGQGELLERISRHGFFLGCSRYPDCDFIQDMSPDVPGDDGENKTEYCENCGREMALKRGRFGSFLACTGYPDCRTTKRLVQGTWKARQPDVPIGEKCPQDGGELLKREGRFGDFIGCQNYPKCKYTRPITLGIKCPKCKEGEFVRRGTAKGRGAGRIFYGCSRYPDCDYTSPHEPIAEPCPKCGAPFIVEKRTKLGNFRACVRENCDWEAPAPLPPPADSTGAPVQPLSAVSSGKTSSPPGASVPSAGKSPQGSASSVGAKASPANGEAQPEPVGAGGSRLKP